MLLLIGLLVLVGVALWAINYAPIIDANIKKILYIIIILISVVYLLSYFGMMPNLNLK